VTAKRGLRNEPILMDSQARELAPGTFVELGGGTTHVLMDGPVSGSPVVFLAGATLALWMWDGLAERIAAAGYRTIRYDRFGLGFSDRPEVEYDLDLFDRQLVDLIDALELDAPVTLVALAFGCPIAAEFALRHPDSVSRLCLTAPDGFGVPLSRGARLALLPLIGEPIGRLVGDRALLARLRGYSKDPRVVARLQAGLGRELEYCGFRRSLRSAVRNVPIEHAEDLYRRANDSGVPVQLVWGRADLVTPAPAEELVRDVFSNAEIHLLDDVGHLPHSERPDEVTSLLVDFLGRRPVANARLR
jgi:pimeloyl-ACP methyl ester carboxylesterase